jgi:ATP-dependent Clp protease, protease subunit
VTAAKGRIKRDDIDRFFDYGLDVSSRTIMLVGDIEEYSVDQALMALHILSQSPGDITIRLATNGGDWYSGMALYDAIAAGENRIKIIGTGHVMSMGGIILQAADERLLTPNATILVHYGNDWAAGHVKDMERRAMENKRTGVIMEDLFLERIHEKHPEYTREQFKQKFAFDTYMSAQEAIDFGLADEILA